MKNTENIETPKTCAGFAPASWLGILEDVFGVSISDKLDSIDIAWDGLSAALATLDTRDVLILKLRYVDGLTLEESGKKLPRKDKLKGPITPEIVRQIEARALRKLRHPSRIRIINSCIAGAWRLYA
jgi:DNA-directed RNA polymerase sigma subunit (sigma70/sigma32)